MVLVAIFMALGWVYSRFVASRINSTRLGDMIAKTGQELRAVITEVHNTYVKALKDAGQDGEWTSKEKAEAKARAVAKFKENLGVKGIKRMTKVLGISGAVDSWLGTQVEATLTDMKQQAKLPKE
jgi:hypothetical protein